MAIEINDLGSTISILNDGEYTIITKQDASVALNGSIVALIDFSGQRYEYNFADVNVPAEASGADLAATLNDYLQTTGGVLNLKVLLTPNQIANAFTYPIDIGLPSSGVGYYWSIKRFDTNPISGSDPYFPATYLGIFPSTAPFNNVWTNSLTFVNSPGTLIVGLLGAGSTFTAGPNYVENDTLQIGADDDSSIGDIYYDVYIQVEKVKL